METRELVQLGARAAAAFLGVSAETKNAALESIISALESSWPEIDRANKADLAAAKISGLAKPLLKRLAFDEKKLADSIEGIKALLALPDPSGRVLEARLLDEGLVLRRVSCPIGLIAMIFESRPDALVQMACLAAKSGNAIVLKGGSEAKESNRALASTIAAAGEKAGLPPHWLTALETRGEISELLKLDEYVDLVIPRGSKEFVAKIMETSRIPVLGHSDGVCHVYVHSDADPKMASDIVLDSKVQYPATCNAAEVLLLHSTYAEKNLAPLLSSLLDAGVTLDVCPRTAALLGASGFAELGPDGKELKYAGAIDAAGDPNLRREKAKIFLKSDNKWSVEYLDMRMAVKIVDSLEEAVEHINRYGSGHTDAIVSASRQAGERFMAGVDSSSVYHNASTRFSDGYRYGLGAEVGIATGKLHARGPMGLSGLLTYKWMLEGSGNVVADYASGKRRFSHLDLPLDYGRE